MADRIYPIAEIGPLTFTGRALEPGVDHRVNSNSNSAAGTVRTDGLTIRTGDGAGVRVTRNPSTGEITRAITQSGLWGVLRRGYSQ